MFLIKEVLAIRQIWNKGTIRISLLRLPLLMIKNYAIIVIEMVIWVIDVQLREMNIMELNVFRFQKEPLLTLKDLKSFGYLKLEISSVEIKEEKEQMVFG